MNEDKREYTKNALRPLREDYPTYQAVYELHPQNDLDNEGLFKKSILIVVDWVRGRVAEDGGDASFLDSYPDPEEYKGFSPENAPDVTPHGGFDAASQYSEKEKSFALRVIEVNTEASFYQSFRTEVAIKKKDDSVLLAVKVVCREAEHEGIADVWRTSFVSRVIMMDEDIIVTEKDCPVEFPIMLGAISLNGKSKQVCEKFKTDFIDNPSRRFPILILSDAILAKIDQNELLKKMVYKIKGLSYITLLEESVNKLFITTMNKPELASELEKGDKCLVITDPRSDDGFKAYLLFNGVEDAEGNDLIDTDILDEVCEYIQNYMRGKEFDYGEMSFLSTLRQAILLDRMPSGASEEEKKELVAMFEKTLADKDEQIHSMSDIIANQNKKIKDLDKSLKAAHHENKQDDLKIKLDDTNAVIDGLKNEVAALEEKNEALRKETLVVKERHKPLFDLPMPQASREKIFEWIEKNYGDKIILHDKAKKTFLADKSNRDFAFICRIIHYIYGYTVSAAENEGNENAIVEGAMAYDVMDEHLEVTGVGKDPMMHHPESYTINISEFDPEAGDVKTDKHVKIGKGMDSDAIRIYFYYDSNIKKSIIGTMLDHLEMGMK